MKQKEFGGVLKNIVSVLKSILRMLLMLTIKDLWHLTKFFGRLREILLKEPYVSTMPVVKLNTVLAPDFSIKFTRVWFTNCLLLFKFKNLVELFRMSSDRRFIVFSKAEILNGLWIKSNVLHKPKQYIQNVQ